MSTEKSISSFRPAIETGLADQIHAHAEALGLPPTTLVNLVIRGWLQAGAKLEVQSPLATVPLPSKKQTSAPAPSGAQLASSSAPEPDPFNLWTPETPSQGPILRRQANPYLQPPPISPDYLDELNEFVCHYAATNNSDFPNVHADSVFDFAANSPDWDLAKKCIRYVYWLSPQKIEMEVGDNSKIPAYENAP